jgi:hypothetical protein
MKQTAIRVEEERGETVAGADKLKGKHPVYYTGHKINITDVHCRQYKVKQSHIYF